MKKLLLLICLSALLSYQVNAQFGRPSLEELVIIIVAVVVVGAVLIVGGVLFAIFSFKKWNRKRKEVDDQAFLTYEIPINLTL